MILRFAVATVCGVTHALTSELVCRCADESCTCLVQLGPEEYEILRSDPALFVVSPGHERGCNGDVLVRADCYVVMRARESFLPRLPKEYSCV